VLQTILLAAGLSKRFGASNKLLYSVDGKPIFLHTLISLHQSQLGNIVVVTGLDRDQVLCQIPAHISYQEVFNPAYNTGMTSSIQAGVAASSPLITAYMICLADQIKIKPSTYALIGKTYDNLYSENEKTILIPNYKSQKANPVILPAYYKTDILQLKSSNGCKPIVLHNKEHTHNLEIDDPGLIYDIDRKEDL
jgi:molybdenum cofactor cytidylyltransferase